MTTRPLALALAALTTAAAPALADDIRRGTAGAPRQAAKMP